MKTNIFLPRNTMLYTLIGFLSIMVTSCGSYQNSSYYDSDGIYGNTANTTVVSVEQNNSGSRYKDYFGSLQSNDQPTEIFTDVDSYTNYENENDTIPKAYSNYSGWGSYTDEVAINVYPSNWGLSFGYGWGYPYYGWGYSGYYPYYGWGYPYYGWGYSGYYGCGYPSYGYGYGNYSYNTSRRGSSYSNYVNSSRNNNSRYYSQNRTNTNSGTNNYANRRNSIYNRSTVVQNGNNASYNTTRTRVNTNTNSSRNDSYTPSRSYNPSSSSSGRSYSGGGSSGGGGGRSSGGGGRR